MFLIIPVLLVACCYQKIDETVTTCNGFKRAFRSLAPQYLSILEIHLSREKVYYLFIFFFLRRGNGLMAKMEFIGMTRRKKEEIRIHKEFKSSNGYSTLEMTTR